EQQHLEVARAVAREDIRGIDSGGNDGLAVSHRRRRQPDACHHELRSDPLCACALVADAALEVAVRPDAAWRSRGGPARKDAHRRPEVEHVTRLDGYAGSLLDARASQHDAVGASEVFDGKGRPDMENGVAPRNRRMIDMKICVARAADEQTTVCR